MLLQKERNRELGNIGTGFSCRSDLVENWNVGED